MADRSREAIMRSRRRPGSGDRRNLPAARPQIVKSSHLGGPSSSIMEQIDAQAADLRYLAQAPASLTPAVSVGTYETPQPHGQQSSPGRSASIGDNSAPLDDGGETRPNPSKRKSFDDGGASGTNAKQTRSKRNRVCLSLGCDRPLHPPPLARIPLSGLTLTTTTRHSTSPLHGKIPPTKQAANQLASNGPLWAKQASQFSSR